MEERLRLVDSRKLKYSVPVPRRLSGVEVEIQIRFIEGEYQYVPRKHTFASGTRLSSDELRAIVNELDRLNKSK